MISDVIGIRLDDIMLCFNFFDSLNLCVSILKKENLFSFSGRSVPCPCHQSSLQNYRCKYSIKETRVHSSIIKVKILFFKFQCLIFEVKHFRD